MQVFYQCDVQTKPIIKVRLSLFIKFQIDLADSRSGAEKDFCCRQLLKRNLNEVFRYIGTAKQWRRYLRRVTITEQTTQLWHLEEEQTHHDS